MTFFHSLGTVPSRREELKMSVRIGAISLWSSLRILDVRLSGPAAFPGLSFESCFDTPLTVIMISGIVGKLRFLGRIHLVPWNLSDVPFGG